MASVEISFENDDDNGRTDDDGRTDGRQCYT